MVFEVKMAKWSEIEAAGAKFAADSPFLRTVLVEVSVE
jgi:hypothetical protein